MKKLILKSLIFSVSVLALHLMVYRYFLPAPPELFQQFKEVLSERKDTIYFGDSSVFFLAPSDQNRKPTYAMLDDLLTQHSISGMCSPALNLSVYEHFVHYIASQPDRPQLLIIPINLRSFSPQWDRRPGYGFEKLIAFLQWDSPMHYYLYKPLSVFKFYKTRIREHAFRDTPVFNGDKQIGHVRDFMTKDARNLTKHNLQNRFTYYYMYSLSAEHRKLRSLQRIVSLANNLGFDIVFYITPVDVQSAAVAVGETFLPRISKNINVIKTIVQGPHVSLVDLSQALPRKDFSWWDDRAGDLFPTEHLRDSGRMYVAEQLSHLILEKLQGGQNSAGHKNGQ